MSSDYTNDHGPTPKPRLQRACDQCRQRKARCDGLDMAGRGCTGCVSAGRTCTYTNFKRQSTRPPRKITAEYVNELEKTIEQMKELLVTVKNDVSPSPGSNSSSESAPLPDRPDPMDIFTAALRNLNHSLDPSTWSDDDDDIYVHIQGRKGVPFGMSSSAHLAQGIVNMKNEQAKMDAAIPRATLPTLEPEFWTPPVAAVTDLPLDINFPTKDVLLELIQAYFERVNIFWPCLHQPTLERQVAADIHIVNPIIGAKVLLVIAIGSQYSTHSKHYWNVHNPQTSLSWKWFLMAQQLRRQLLISLPSVTLDELQFDCLMSLFLIGCHLGHSGWVFCGVGLRVIQCAGAQKRSKYIHVPPLESELSKRVVWIFTVNDIIGSAALGRNPMHILTDLGQLIECDDEFSTDGETPQEAFQQPLNQPSKLSYFNRMIPLMQILEVVLNTIYSARYLKAHLSVNVLDSDQHLVRELDSAMNKWMDAIPAHLRWDPNIDNNAFFSQSALLHCAFYFTQILIHQPFITLGDKTPSAPLLPSLAICLNAARACCRIAESHVNRANFSVPFMECTVFASAMIMLTSIYRKKKLGTSVNMEKEMVDVRRCLAILESGGDRWIISYRMSQVLRDLASITPELDEPQLSHHTQEAPSNHFLDITAASDLLSKSWGSLAGGWNLYSDIATNPSGPLAQASSGLPYDILWQGPTLSPSDGMNEPFPGLNPFSGHFPPW